MRSGQFCVCVCVCVCVCAWADLSENLRVHSRCNPDRGQDLGYGLILVKGSQSFSQFQSKPFTR